LDHWNRHVHRFSSRLILGLFLFLNALS
jgi:hypothetical protein